MISSTTPNAELQLRHLGAGLNDYVPPESGVVEVMFTPFFTFMHHVRDQVACLTAQNPAPYNQIAAPPAEAAFSFKGIPSREMAA